jgi:L,D-transpeptidase ErfK/SrfK
MCAGLITFATTPAAITLAAFMLAQTVAAADLPLRGDLAGAVGTYVTKDEDTLHEIARQNELGYVELRAANPDVDPWLPGDGAMVTLPTAFVLPAAERRGIVINLAEQRLYYFRRDPASVVTYPIGIPSCRTLIPLGATTVVAKRKNPTWFPPPSLRDERPDLPESVPPGPDNPLGTAALSLGWPNFVIHGTNKPDGVGRRVSHGCIRLYPENIDALFDMVPVGTRVTTVDQPVKVGWSDGILYLEVHPTQDEADDVEAHGRIENPSLLDAEQMVRIKAGDLSERVDWALVKQTARARRGIPIPIARRP